ncbi:MAG: 30S ribosomal protein S17 [Candidatus Omnitrophica bacterium]|nr:30S ribosomal protein S17 [Candidatus Omnitrophota bacterium]
MADRHQKERVGIVLASKMEKTAVVQVTRLVQHPIYHKVVRLRKKYLVHDEKKEAKVGSKVRIRETRPLSKAKRWRLVETLASEK